MLHNTKPTEIKFSKICRKCFWYDPPPLTICSIVVLANGPVNGPCPCSLRPRYQNEVKCSAFDMEMIFHSHANKTHFHKKSCELCLILKVRIFGTRSGGLLFGSFNNDDGDGNKNFKKVTICTCVTLFCTFLCRHCSLLLCIAVEAGGGGRVNTQREPLRRREQSLLGLIACSRRLDRGNGANRCEETGTGHVTARLGRENA